MRWQWPEYTDHTPLADGTPVVPMTRMAVTVRPGTDTQQIVTIPVPVWAADDIKDTTRAIDLCLPDTPWCYVGMEDEYASA